MTLRSVVSSVLIVVAVACSSSGSGDGSGKESPPSPSSGGAGAATAAPPAASGPARSDMDCKTYLQKAGEMSKSMDIQMAFDDGSWGPTPAPLQVLPAGVTLCGAGYFVDKKSGEPEKGSGNIASIILKSSLFGKDLKAAYEPVMTKAGCTFDRDTSGATSTQLSWNCPKEACGGVVTMLTDVAYNFASFACGIP
jgi:hypothetical protein